MLKIKSGSSTLKRLSTNAILLVVASGCAVLAYGSTADRSVWFLCDDVSACVRVIGAGGWPVAVNKTHAKAYLERVAQDAPHTTYFMPGDCFSSDAEKEIFFARTQDAVACERGLCVVSIEPECE